jgi:hypothetical protein
MSLHKIFMMCQVKKIDKSKWYHGHHINDDPGTDFITDWIKHNAADYRGKWFSSSCKDCRSQLSCGWKAVSNCDNHIASLNSPVAH